MTDMKKRLEAFRAAKTAAAEAKVAKKAKKAAARSDSPEVMEVNRAGMDWAARGREHLEEQDMEPLHLLRKFLIQDRDVGQRGDKLDFGGIFHDKECRTQLKVKLVLGNYLLS